VTGHLLVRPILNGAFAVRFYPRQGCKPGGELVEVTVESEIDLLNLLEALEIASSSAVSPPESRPDREHLRYFPADISEEKMRNQKLLAQKNGRV
jgi:hypothetical protein